MQKQLIQVRAFQKAFEQTLNDKPTLLSGEESELRFNLAKEELEEYDDAQYDNNLVEILDSLVDQAYILLGTVNAHGLQDVFLEAFNRVHINNMEKLHDGKVVKNEFGKVIKPEGFVAVKLDDLVR